MKQVIALSVALAVAMVGSYLTWTDDSEPVATDGTEVYRATEGDLESLTWTSENLNIVVRRKTDGLGDYLWLESREVRKTTKPVEAPEPEDSPADGEEDDAPPPEPATETVEEVLEVAFAGNEAAEKLWADFQPLVALRELAQASELDAEAFGLDEPTGTVVATVGGKPIELVIGGETYGSKDRYAKLGERVFLLDDGDLRPLQYAASRLVERSLFPLPEADVEQVVATRADGTELSFVHRNRDDKAAAYWAWAEQPDEQDDQVDAWVGRVLKAKLRAYTTDDDAGALRPLFSYEVRGGDKAYAVEILEGADGKLYARAAFTRSLVELTASLVDGLSDELEELAPPSP